MRIDSRFCWVLASALLLLALMLSACGGAAPATAPTQAAAAAPTAAAGPAAPQPASADKSPIMLGISHDVTGSNADAGRAERDAAILAIEEWNRKGGVNGGREIKYTFRDNAGDPAKATAIAKEYLNMKIVALLGATSSTVGIPESKVFSAERIPVMGASSSTDLLQDGPDGKWYYFTGGTTNPVIAEVPLVDMAKRGYKKIAFIYSNVAWPQDLVKTSKKLIADKYGAQSGMSTVGDFPVDINATDLTAEVMKLRDLKPDAIHATFYPVNAKAYYRALADIGWQPPAPTYPYWGLIESVYNTSEPKLLWGSYGYAYSHGDKPEFAQKTKDFVARFGYQPVENFGMAYDGTNLLLKAIDAVGTDGPAIRDYLESKSAGTPIILGRPGATASLTKESFHSTVKAADMAILYINEKGEKVWQK